VKPRNKKIAEKALRKLKNTLNQINFKRKKAEFKFILNQAKKTYWENFCSNLNHQSNLKQVWKAINSMKNSTSTNTLPTKLSKGDFTDSKKLVDSFADIFKSVSSNTNIDKNIIANRNHVVYDSLNDIKHKIQKNSDILIQDCKLINAPFKLNEMEMVLKTVNPKSSPGKDDIPYSYYIHSPITIKNCILDMINKSWENNDIPDSWKMAVVKPILKANKDKNDIASYRPISLTNTISKIMEKMVVYRLNWYLEKNNLLKPTQSGFRKMCSTSDPIIRLKQEAELAINSGNITVAVLIDFTRAFDLLWVDGLILKLMKMSISGHMLKWIKNFLTNRKYIVKIGEDKSYTYETDNGTPQGSAISPLLFLIMVNDFPELSQFTSDAFFADDCTIWRSGTNLAQILHHLQEDLIKIEDWCKKWGFIINTDKTVGIIFTNKKGCDNLKPLKLQGKNITCLTSVKLLGVTLDKHLTFNAHVDDIVDRSKKTLNLMRCLSGTTWGASKNVLLTIYKALILSIVDYCCFIYTNCSRSVLKKLDTIQYKSLLLATGGLKGTALNALLGECNELPLNYRREKLTINYLIKISNNSRNSANSILKEKKYYQLSIKDKPYFTDILNKFLQDTNIDLKTNDQIFKNNPWYNLCDMVNLSLLNDNTIKNDPEYISNYIEKFLDSNNYQTKTIIICDGSVTKEGKVGAAFVSSLLPNPVLLKLPDHMSVYYSEAYAILQAIYYANSLTHPDICIISDCAKVLQDIKYYDIANSPHPALMQEICQVLANLHAHKITLIWMPGHYNHPFIQKADESAKLATSLLQIPPISYTKDEIILLLENWIWTRWQKEWSRESICCYQEVFASCKNYSFRFNLSRKREVTISRLRLMQSRLNSGLKKINLHVNGHCEECGVLETTEHFINECLKTKQLRDNLRQVLGSSRIWKLEEILSNPSSIMTITDYIIENRIKI
jgi:ribonuclease HI